MGHTPGDGRVVEPPPEGARRVDTGCEPQADVEGRRGRPVQTGAKQTTEVGGPQRTRGPRGWVRATATSLRTPDVIHEGRFIGGGDPVRRLPRLSPDRQRPHEAAASTARPWAPPAGEVHTHPEGRYGGVGGCERDTLMRYAWVGGPQAAAPFPGGDAGCFPERELRAATTGSLGRAARTRQGTTSRTRRTRRRHRPTPRPRGWW